jgi:hypothetical protein
MAVVASATGAFITGGALATGTVGAGLLGGAVLGAGAGALYSGITGDGNVLNSALTGGLIGGGIGGLGAYFGGAAALDSAAIAAGGAGGGGAFVPAGGASFATPAALAGSANTPALASSLLTSANPAALDALAAANGVVPEMAASLPGQGLLAAPASLPATIAPATASNLLNTQTAGNFLTSDASSYGPGWGPKGFEGGPKTGLSGMDMLGYGLAGTAALSLLGGMNQNKIQTGTVGTQNQAMIRPYTYNVSQNQSAYPTTPQYGPNGLPILPTSEKSYFNQSYTAGTPYKAAAGGLMSVPTPGLMQTGPADVNFMGNDMYPTSQQHRSYYATPTQMPTSAQEVMASYEPKTNPLTGQMMKNMADGGITYDPATQRYSGLPQSIPAVAGGVTYNPATQTYSGLPSAAPAGNVPQLPAELVSQLTPQWQAANPNAFAYDPVAQRYSAATPNMNQLSAYKAEQDRIAAEQAAASQPSDGGGGGANGGLMPYNLGSYSDGGRLLKGPGDGVSDDIPAVIGNKQPARLADGEFVIPARIVSELGNGSTDAGAKRLYAMMDNIQAGRKKTIGKKNVAKDTKAKKHLLA